MRYEYQVSGAQFSVSVERQGEGYRILVNGQPLEIDFLDNQPGQIDLRISGKPHTFYYASEAGKRWFSYRGCTYLVGKPVSQSRRTGESASGDFLRAPMPAQVTAVEVEPGAVVEKGQTLLLLEAMKMEIRIQAPHPGAVIRVHARPGDRVERDQILVELEQEPSHAR